MKATECPRGTEFKCQANQPWPYDADGFAYFLCYGDWEEGAPRHVEWVGPTGWPVYVTEQFINSCRDWTGNLDAPPMEAVSAYLPWPMEYAGIHPDGHLILRRGDVERAPRNSAVVVFSGGLDSTVLLYDMLNLGYHVRALSVDYGQRHRKELEQAKLICRHLGIEHRVADLSSITPLLAGSSLTSPEIDVPDGHYTEEIMKQTVVPNRNMIMLSVAIAWAISTKSDYVAYGAHDGDHAVYPDCRPDFAATMAKAARSCDWHQVKLIAPFLGMAKDSIVKVGVSHQVPFNLTWSCYKGGEFHCGTCGTCVERREAFKLAGVPDPTIYEPMGRVMTPQGA